MSTIYQWWRSLRLKFVGMVALGLAVAITAVACGGGSGGGEGESVGISPELVVDYIHTVAESDRTAYTKHVIGRLEVLEGDENAKGVVPAEATEFWEQEEGIPLPAQMFRMGAELASSEGDFTYGLISPWNINDNQAPKDDFEKEGMDKVVETGEPYKAYREIAGSKYFSAIYPDIAVADACVTCHNEHPVHKERYPDKVFKLDDVMGGVVINLPLGGA